MRSYITAQIQETQQVIASILAALQEAKERGIVCIGMTGNRGGR